MLRSTYNSRVFGAVRRVKQTVVEQTASYAARIRRVAQVLGSDYPSLVFDADLERRFESLPFPQIELTSIDEELSHVAMGGTNIFWPSKYRISGLPWVYREVFDPYRVNPHAYESHDIKLKPGTWVIDAGASEGFFVHFALQRGCRVLAIEPLEALTRSLSRTFQSEICRDRVRVIHGGLGEEAGSQWLHVPEADAISSHVTVVKSNSSERVRIYSLDELVQDQKIDHVDFVKMDIEGSELGAVKGSRRILAEHCPQLSLAVYHEVENATAIRKIIKQVQPRYHVKFRGVWFRPSSRPRPYMLLASIHNS